MTVSDKSTKRVFIMPRIENKYLNRAKKSELKVLYYIFSNGGNIDVDTASEELEETKDSIIASLAFWRCAGVIDENENIDDDSKADTSPAQDTSRGSFGPNVITPKDVRNSAKVNHGSYTLSEIASSRKTDKTFGSLISYLEKLTGHLYNAAEQGIILYLYDTLGINYEVIMGVAQYCVSLGKTSVRYIEKTAMNINDEGVGTYAELENYLGCQSKRNEYRENVKKIIGASDRALTKSEKAHIDRWEKEFKSSDELISLAYEKTVSKINKPKISYMSKILESWYEKGLKTPEEVDGYFKNASDKKNNEEIDDGRLDFELDDFFEKPDLS